MADEAFTSDGEPRPNMQQALAMAGIALPNPVPYDIGLSARVSVLYTIGTALNTAGASPPVPVISRDAAYDNSSVVARIADITNALNTMGASPPLPVYTSLDYNAFSSVMNNIANTMGTMQ